MKSKSNVSLVVRIMNCLVAIQNLVVQFLLEGHLRKTKVNSIRLGTDYGGWWVPIQITEDAKNWQVISCGLGHDISFDREITSLGIPVLGVEVEDHWIDEIRNSSDKPPLLHLVQGYVGAGTGELDVSKLLSLVENQFGFGKEKFLKMDIEGAEISIIEKSQILSLSFNCVAFELDYLSLVPFLSFRTRVQRYMKCRRIFRNLTLEGFHLYKRENWNFHFSKF